MFNIITTQLWKRKDDLSEIEYSNNMYHVELDIIETEVLSIKLFKDSKLIKKEKIKGKLRRGLFYLDNKYRDCSGIPFIFGTCQKNKRRIGVTKAGQLLVNTSFENSGTAFLVFAAGSTYNTTYMFNRL